MDDLTPTNPDAFWERVDVRGPDECWPWKLGTGDGGYGKTKIRGRTVIAHRVAYRVAKGPIPQDKPCILHTCDNPPCCNPAHLWPGTNADNSADAVAKGRQKGAPRGALNGQNTRPERRPRGERNGMALLTAEKVRAIREGYADGASYEELAARFGVSRANISRVVRRVIWTEGEGGLSPDEVAARLRGERAEQARQMARNRVAAQRARMA